MHTAELDCFNTMAINSKLPCSYHAPALFDFDSLYNISDSAIKGIVILGSNSSVYERLPWQITLEKWLKPKLDNAIPTLGICYGHQMLAYMFGGEIDYIDKEQTKEKGFRTIQIEQSGPFPKSTSTLVVTHNETIIKVPDSFEIFAFSEKIATEGIKHRTLPIWSFQAHPEATADFALSRGMAFDKTSNPFWDGHLIISKFLEFAAS